MPFKVIKLDQGLTHSTSGDLLHKRDEKVVQKNKASKINQEVLTVK